MKSVIAIILVLVLVLPSHQTDVVPASANISVADISSVTSATTVSADNGTSQLSVNAVTESVANATGSVAINETASDTRTTSVPASYESKNVTNATQRILDILPIDNITKILEEHLKTDGGYTAAIYYLQGPEWQKLWSALNQKSEWKELMLRFKESGAPAGEFIAYLEKSVREAKPIAKPAPKPTMRAAVNEVLDVVPFEKLIAALNQNTESSGGDQKVSKANTKAQIKKVKALDEYKKVADAINKLEPLSPELKDIIFSTANQKFNN